MDSASGARRARKGEPTSRLRRALGVGVVADDELVRGLYDEHAGPLLGFVLRLTGDRQHAEDVVQETLLRAWRHPEALAGSHGSLRPWLYTVARNLVIDRARSRKARPPEVGEQGLDSLPADDQIARAVDAWEVAEALWSLRAEHRDVLRETYYLGRSVAEAAQALGVPEGTVKSRTYYALRALRLALEERGFTP